MARKNSEPALALSISVALAARTSSGTSSRRAQRLTGMRAITGFCLQYSGLMIRSQGSDQVDAVWIAR